MHLFSSQQASDRIIDKVAALLGCADRNELGIVASPRGLLAGTLTLIPPRGQGRAEIKCEAGVSTLVPTELSISNLVWTLSLPDSDERMVLVVEKEAVFKHLLEFQRRQSARVQLNLAEVVLVTGKGYPDCATRALVRLLSGPASRIKMFGLFDSDPYGIDIHRQYLAACSNCNTVEWIGVDLEDFLPIDGDQTGALIQLRNDERAKAVQLLRTELPPLLRARLAQLLLCGYKVEIEAAYDVDGGLVGYLGRKLFPGRHH